MDAWFQALIPRYNPIITDIITEFLRVKGWRPLPITTTAIGRTNDWRWNFQMADKTRLGFHRSVDVTVRPEPSYTEQVWTGLVVHYFAKPTPQVLTDLAELRQAIEDQTKLPTRLSWY